MALVEIKVTGMFPVAIVDEIDKDLAGVKWSVIRTRGYYYLQHIFAGKQVLLQRMILSRILGRTLKRDEFCSFRNLNPFDCRRTNLRLATKTQCIQNSRKSKNNTSGFKGVHFFKRTGKWTAKIVVDGCPIHLGYFDEPEFAYVAYCRAAEKYHGEFARFE